MVALLPLHGHDAVRRGAGEWLAHKLHAETRFNVLSPGLAEAKLSARTSGAGEPSVDEVREFGRLLGARIVISGSINFVSRGYTPRIELQLVDVLSKEVLAQVTEEAGFALGVHDPYELAQIAVEQAAKKTLAALQKKGGPAFQSEAIPKPDRGYRFRSESAETSPCGFAGSRPDAVGNCR